MEPWSGRRGGVGRRAGQKRYRRRRRRFGVGMGADEDGAVARDRAARPGVLYDESDGEDSLDGDQGRSVKGEDAERSQRVSFGRPGSFPPKSSARPARA